MLILLVAIKKLLKKKPLRFYGSNQQENVEKRATLRNS